MENVITIILSKMTSHWGINERRVRKQGKKERRKQKMERGAKQQ